MLKIFTWIKLIVVFIYLTIFRIRITSHHIVLKDGFGTEEFLHITVKEWFTMANKYFYEYKNFEIKVECIYQYYHITLKFYK